MPKGASKGFTVLTSNNLIFTKNLIEFLKENKFASTTSINKEYMKNNPKTNSLRGHGIWGLMPPRIGLHNLLHSFDFVTNERYLDINGKSNKIYYWSLTEDWEKDYETWQERRRQAKFVRENHGAAKWVRYKPTRKYNVGKATWSFAKRRNKAIFYDYSKGETIENLSEKHSLKPKTIKKILREQNET